MSVNGEPTQVSHAFIIKNYDSIHEATRRFIRCSSENAADSCCMFILAVGETTFWPLVSKYVYENCRK